MCGPDLPRPSLGGALAVLSAPRGGGSPRRRRRPALCGSLVFHGRRPAGARPCVVATHATFTPLPRRRGVGDGAPEEEEEEEEEEDEQPDISDYVVGIQ